ncbi:MAG TPA: hypothetical protein VF735_10860 [Pyrinomonadaceae bacterium]|jgi:hypothetical protein
MPAFVLCLFCVCVARAQDAKDSLAPPAVTVIKLKWSRELQPFRQYRDLVAPRSYSEEFFPTFDSNSTLPSARPRRVPSPFPPSGRFSYIYVYSAKLMNDSAKAIKAVAWDYVFSNPGSNEELKRHQFYSFRKIRAHEKGTLRGSSAAPPSNVVSAGGLGKDGRSPYDERVEFRCVFYADGTEWKHPAASELECFNLRNRERADKRPRR